MLIEFKRSIEEVSMSSTGVLGGTTRLGESLSPLTRTYALLAVTMLSLCRFLPIMDRIFAKKGEAEALPKVRLVTVWLGKLH